MILSLIVSLVALSIIVVVLLIRLKKTTYWEHFEARLIHSVNADPPIRIEVPSQAPEARMAEAVNKLIAKASDRQNEVMKLKQNERQRQQQHLLNKDYESRLDRLKLVSQLGQEITKGLTVNELFQKLSEVLHSSFPLLMIQLGIRVNDKWQIHTSFQDGSFRLEETTTLHAVPDWVVRHAESLVLKEIDHHFRRYFDKTPIWQELSGANSCLSLPINNQSEVSSWLLLVSSIHNPLSEPQLDYVKALSPYVAVSLDNASIYLDLEKEKQKSDDLLRNILPEEVAEELKVKGKADARLFENVTVLFTDFVNFTGTSAKMSPQELVQELDNCFKTFDHIMKANGLEKIKTIGDAYMAVSGLPQERKDHAEAAVKAAQAILAYVRQRKEEGTLVFDIRIGLHSGPVVAGIVGHTKFAYDIWGDTVNTASRLESSGEVGRIHLSEEVHQLLGPEISRNYRGEVFLKNKGKMLTWWAD